MGAPVRLHLWGGGEGASVVRREDWDSLSDWGQLARGLMHLAEAPFPDGSSLFAEAQVGWDAVRPGAFASVDLGVDDAR